MNRINRAESPAYTSVGQRPTKNDADHHQALKGRNKYVAITGLNMGGDYHLYPRRCHWAKLCRAFSATIHYQTTNTKGIKYE